MIDNLLTYLDGKTKEPRLLEWQSDAAVLTSHLSDGFKKTCAELNKRGIDTRLVMIPLALATGSQTLTSSTTGSWIEAQRKNRVKRLVVNKVTCSDGGGSNVWYLDGSDDNGTTWTNITSLTNTNGSGKISITFDAEYKYYRFRLVKGTTISFTGFIYLVETSFDDLIIYKYLEKTFRALSRKEDDDKMAKAKMYSDDFEGEIAGLSYSYDSDESGTIEEDESVKRKRTSVRIGL